MSSKVSTPSVTFLIHLSISAVSTQCNKRHQNYTYYFLHRLAATLPCNFLLSAMSIKLLWPRTNHWKCLVKNGERHNYEHSNSWEKVHVSYCRTFYWSLFTWSHGGARWLEYMKDFWSKRFLVGSNYEFTICYMSACNSKKWKKWKEEI